ncbi:hypothetical protein M407DRAFT_24289 [Tulasnella calospora MUT 4182]|uniref:Uncharacterized protein n=1 Tax=Tulasnella calospora MUT 4182 TaxID=1051891 RepID=A0A0C3LYD0_9AGAM|nr:hypothetical protein M407DRAFT_24289 [Tulasnella calospora MUT 4182]
MVKATQPTVTQCVSQGEASQRDAQFATEVQHTTTPVQFGSSEWTCNWTKNNLLARFETLLQRYRLEPQSFRDKLRASGAVIGGLSALYFLLNADERDLPALDIFTTPEGSSQFSRLMIKMTGPPNYFSLDLIITTLIQTLFVPVEDFQDHPFLRPAEIERLVQLQYVHQSEALYINVVVTKLNNSSIVPLLRTSTTATMGYISADSLHHLYPELLSRKLALASVHQTKRCCIPVRGVVPHWGLASVWEDHVGRLMEMGFVVQENVDCADDTDLGCSAEPRGFRDSRSLRFDFDDLGVKKSSWYEVGAGFVGGDVRMVPKQGCANPGCKRYGLLTMTEKALD